MNRVIRVASSEDAPFIVDMIKAATDEGVFHSNGHSVEEFRKYAFENPREGYSILVCEIRNNIVGYIDSRVRMEVGHILGLYVKPAHRKKGVGKDLMKKTLNEFRKGGCHKARLEVFASNHEAIDFYNHLGFVQEGYLHEDEEKKDTIILSKFLKK